MKVLIAGAAGHLGAAMVEEFSRGRGGPAGHDVVALTHGELDITDAGAVTAAVSSARPDAVVNCAAYNDVDGAEDHPVAAFELNAFGVQALAQAAGKAGAVFVHFSTDFVFDGDADRPYTEEDRPGPRSVYAASKLVGEWLAREATRHYVLRVESLFGGPTAGGQARLGSIGTVVKRILERQAVPVFVDRVLSPTYASDAARATAHLLEAQPEPGVYHCVNGGSCRWDELALEAARQLGIEATLQPITLEALALKAQRPRYCALSNAKLARAGMTMPHWRDALSSYLAARINS